jgi:hypothetical protein
VSPLVNAADREYAPDMPSYSLDIEIPGEDNRYVPSHDLPTEMRAGHQFEYAGYKLQVAEVARKQFDAPGEPDLTIRAIPA